MDVTKKTMSLTCRSNNQPSVSSTSNSTASTPRECRLGASSSSLLSSPSTAVSHTIQSLTAGPQSPPLCITTTTKKSSSTTTTTGNHKSPASVLQHLDANPVLSGVATKFNQIMTQDFFACGTPRYPPVEGCSTSPILYSWKHDAELLRKATHRKVRSVLMSPTSNRSKNGTVVDECLFDPEEEEEEEDEILDETVGIEIDTENSLRPSYELYRV